jgi:hypothetical protein
VDGAGMAADTWSRSYFQFQTFRHARVDIRMLEEKQSLARRPMCRLISSFLRLRVGHSLKLEARLRSFDCGIGVGIAKQAEFSRQLVEQPDYGSEYPD